LTKDSLIIALSQSGETIDVVEPLNRLRKKAARFLPLRILLGSTIYRWQTTICFWVPGPKSRSFDKAYIAKVSIILMLAYSLIGQDEKIKNILLQTADEVQRLVSEKTVDEIRKSPRF